jgi:hypothetical protein
VADPSAGILGQLLGFGGDASRGFVAVPSGSVVVGTNTRFSTRDRRSGRIRMVPLKDLPPRERRKVERHPATLDAAELAERFNVAGGGIGVIRRKAMGLLDTVGGLLEKTIDAAPAVLETLNREKDRELQRDLARMGAGPGRRAQGQGQNRARRLAVLQSQRRGRGFPNIINVSGGGMAGAPFERADFLPNGGGGFDVPFVDFAPQGAGGAFEPFVAGGTSIRAQAFMLPNPQTGAMMWFRPAGRPVLFSRDFGIVRRVDRLAKRAAKTRRGRR